MTDESPVSKPENAVGEEVSEETAASEKPNVVERSSASNDGESKSRREENPDEPQKTTTETSENNSNTSDKLEVEDQEIKVRDQTNFVSNSLLPFISLFVIVLAACGFFVARGPGLILALAASTLGVTIWLVWTSLLKIGTADDMEFEEALSLGAPSATEEQKHAVLRALKDLEYERHVGKISEEDFESVSADYRARAKRLIAEQDETMKDRMDAAQKLVENRLKERDLSPSPSEGSSGEEA